MADSGESPATSWISGVEFFLSLKALERPLASPADDARRRNYPAIDSVVLNETAEMGGAIWWLGLVLTYLQRLAESFDETVASLAGRREVAGTLRTARRTVRIH